MGTKSPFEAAGSPASAVRKVSLPYTPSHCHLQISTAHAMRSNFSVAYGRVSNMNMTKTLNIPESDSARGISFPDDVERDDHGELPRRAKTRRPLMLQGFAGYC